MKTVKEILEKSAEFLENKHTANPRRQAEEVIADSLGIKRLDLYLQFDRPLTNDELDQCRIALKRRSDGEPAQYIRGEVDFLDCRISVSPKVLIPRQETEILAAKVTEYFETVELEGKTLWDICCGSGCLGIAIKKKFPQLEVVLSDISPDALDVARKNAETNGVEVIFLEGDLLDPFAGKKADFVVCNPPYIPPGEYETLDREVRDYEPKIALVAENEGLEFYQRLAQGLPNMLHSPGKAWFEIGYNQGNALVELFCPPQWKNSRFECDWSGHNRFFFLEIE